MWAFWQKIRIAYIKLNLNIVKEGNVHFILSVSDIYGGNLTTVPAIPTRFMFYFIVSRRHKCRNEMKA